MLGRAAASQNTYVSGLANSASDYRCPRPAKASRVCAAPASPKRAGQGPPTTAAQKGALAAVSGQLGVSLSAGTSYTG